MCGGGGGGGGSAASQPETPKGDLLHTLTMHTNEITVLEDAPFWG